VTQQVLLTLAVRILLIGAGFLSSVITARFLGPEGRGVFFYWTTLAALAIQFGNLGLQSSNVYLLTKGRARLSALAVNSLWVSIAGGAVLAGLLTLSIWLKDGSLQDKWFLLSPTLIMIPSGLYFLLGTNLLVADERFGEYNAFELINRYLGLAAILLAAWCWRTPEALLTVTCIIAALICLPLYGRLNKLGGGGGGSLTLVRKGFSYALRAYLVCVIAFGVLRLNALLLEQYINSEILGVWSIAAQLLDVIIVIPSTIALILLPKIMRSSQPYQMMLTQLRLVVMILIPVCALVGFLGYDAIMLLYGGQFRDAYVMLLWGLPGAIALGMTSIISQYLASEGMPFTLVWVWMIGLAAELLLAIWLIPIHGGTGAMMSLSVAYLVILGMVWALAGHHHSKQRGKISAEKR
jgi:O-antigen/teichoic acid export membrane protein